MSSKEFYFDDFQKMSEIENANIELISEWPPKDDGNESEHSENNDEKVEEYQHQVKRKKVSCDHPTADIAMARWLRINLPELRQKYKFDGIRNPKTLMNLASETGEGRQYLESQVKILRRETGTQSDPKYFHILSTFYDRLHDLDKALENSLIGLSLSDLCPKKISELNVKEYLEKLPTLNEEERSLIWLHSKLEKEKSIKMKIPAENQDRKVVCLDYSEVTVEQFQSLCRSKTPVLFNNVPNPCKHNWTFDFIKSTIGSCKFEVKKPVKSSTEWAGLETDGSKSVSEFLELFDKDDNNVEYLFDWSLPLYGPSLNLDFTVPEIVADNYLTRTNGDALYNKSWPSLFIAKAGTSSGLHIDAFGSHFWMYLVSGQKKWTFYPPEVNTLRSVTC